MADETTNRELAGARQLIKTLEDEATARLHDMETMLGQMAGLAAECRRLRTENAALGGLARYVGRGVEFPCPECGEQLFVYIPAGDGPTEVMRRRDIPPEDESDGEE